MLHHHWLCSVSLSLSVQPLERHHFAALTSLSLCWQLRNCGPLKTGAGDGVFAPFAPACFTSVAATSHPCFQVPPLSDVLQFSSWRCCITILLPSWQISDVLHSRCHSSVFLLVAAAPHSWPVNMLVVDFMSMVSLLCALQLFVGAGNLLLASSDVQPLEMCCVTISLSRFFTLVPQFHTHDPSRHGEWLFRSCAPFSCCLLYSHQLPAQLLEVCCITVSSTSTPSCISKLLDS